MRKRRWLLYLFLAMSASVLSVLALFIGFGSADSGGSARDRSIDLAEQRRVAAHEIGHAVVATYLDGPDEVRRITVYSSVQSGGLYGMTETRDHNRLNTADDVMREAAVFMGGRAADRIVNGAPTEGAGSDIGHVNDLIWDMHLVSGLGGSLLVRTKAQAPPALWTQVEHDIDASNACAEAIVSANADTVAFLANVIMLLPPDGAARVLPGDALRAFLAKNPLRPVPDAARAALMTGCRQYTP